MADPASPKASQGESPLQKEAIGRREEARTWKSRRLLDFKECYFFLAPSRQRQLSSQTAPAVQTMLDEPELNTDQGFIVAQDFTTEIINTYMPEAQDWCESKGGEGFEDIFEQIKDDAKAADKKIFSAIRASNIYAELPKACNPDLCIGTAALYIDRPYGYKPIETLAVPMRELDINLGPNGEIDDRFITRYPRNTYIRKLLGEDIWNKLKPDQRKVYADNPNGRTEISWGWWRQWEKEDDEWWQHVVLLGGKELVHDVEINGEGSCPLIVMRFNPTADWPWAIGPMIEALPSFRQMDDLDRQWIEAAERSWNPAIKYPDDSVTNLEQGLEPGMGYPFRPGMGEDFGPIYQQPPLDPGIFAYETKLKGVRKIFFVDHPEQTGDTPPTLGQWLDELARVQRRIGTAGTSFWREGPCKIFLRYKYLLLKAGTIKLPKDKEGRLITTVPYNPTQRAAEQQEIATAIQCAQILAQMFPEEWRMWMDGKGTMKLFIDKMRTAGLLKMRDEAQVQQALQRISQLIGARHEPGAPNVPAAAGAPAAP